MSYSLSLKASSVAAAFALASTKFDAEVVALQSPHCIDRPAVLGNLQAALNVVGEPGEGEELMVQMSGSIGVQTTRTAAVSISCSVWIKPVDAPPIGAKPLQAA